MNSKSSIFFDQWQACLRAHYIHVIRANDTVTERTLRSVLLQSGLAEDDLGRLYDEALALGPLAPGDKIMPAPGDTQVEAPTEADLEPDLEDVYTDETLETLETLDPALDDFELSEDIPEEDEDEPDDDTDYPPPPSQQLSMF
jgi:hypothetical protein